MCQIKVLIDCYSDIYGSSSVPSLFSSESEAAEESAANAGNKTDSEQGTIFVKGPNAGKAGGGLVAGGIHRNSRREKIVNKYPID